MAVEFTIVSILPFDIVEDKPGLIPNRYEIKACKDGTPQVLHVSSAVHYVYIPERSPLRIVTPAEELARSLVEDFVNAQIGITPDASPGIWNLLGKLTAQEAKGKPEYLINLQRHRKWLTNIVKMADDDWTRYHSNQAISDFQRAAAVSLGYNPEQHPWMAPQLMLQSVRCPSCGLAVSPDLVV